MGNGIAGKGRSRFALVWFGLVWFGWKPNLAATAAPIGASPGLRRVSLVSPSLSRRRSIRCTPTDRHRGFPTTETQQGRGQTTTDRSMENPGAYRNQRDRISGRIIETKPVPSSVIGTTSCARKNERTVAGGCSSLSIKQSIHLSIHLSRRSIRMDLSVCVCRCAFVLMRSFSNISHRLPSFALFVTLQPTRPNTNKQTNKRTTGYHSRRTTQAPGDRRTPRQVLQEAEVRHGPAPGHDQDR